MSDETGTFWSISNRGALVVELIELFDWLSKKGYRYKAEKDVYSLYKIEGHIIKHAYVQDFINEIIYHLHNEYKEDTVKTVTYPVKPPETFCYSPLQVLERITKYGYSKIFNEKNLQNLQVLEVEVHRHTKESAVFYFKNKFVRVQASGPSLHEYSELKGNCVFEDNIIKHEIALIDLKNIQQRSFAKNAVCFGDFLRKISIVTDPISKVPLPEQSEEKLAFLMQLLGYLLHDYRQKGLTDFSVIFSDDEAGGTGKGILFQALKELTNVCLIDCKKKRIFDPISLTHETRIKVYNDIQPKFFNFEEAYNEITDGGTIHYKNGHEENIDYKETWKVALTSNHIIKGNNDSDIRRQKVFNMHIFFNKKRTVQHEYGHSFFSEDWQPQDWVFFFNMMFECVTLWLDSNYSISFEDEEYDLRKIEAEYPIEFQQYVDSLKGGYHPTGQLYNNFKKHPEYGTSLWAQNISTQRFGKNLTKYLTETGRDHHKTANRTEIYIAPKQASKQEAKQLEFQTNYNKPC
jgi:hypothetical protein